MMGQENQRRKFSKKVKNQQSFLEFANKYLNPIKLITDMIDKLKLIALLIEDDDTPPSHPFKKYDPIKIPHKSTFFEGKKTLVLDLDETLVHSRQSEFEDHDFQFSVQIPMKNDEISIFVSKRPHLEIFLESMAEIFEIIIFTASLQDYAKPCILKIDKKNNVNVKLYRENCIYRNKTFIKDISSLNRELSEIIIIDNQEKAFQLQPENGILINDYFGDKQDIELFKLIPFLRFLSEVSLSKILCFEIKVKDIRPISKFLEKFNKKEPFVFINQQGIKTLCYPESYMPLTKKQLINDGKKIEGIQTTENKIDNLIVQKIKDEIDELISEDEELSEDCNYPLCCHEGDNPIDDTSIEDKSDNKQQEFLNNEDQYIQQLQRKRLYSVEMTLQNNSQS